MLFRSWPRHIKLFLGVLHEGLAGSAVKLYAFGFDTIAVVASDLYLLDPEAAHGAEQGVRLEVRLVERDLDPDALFAAAPVTMGRPLWRADLLESVDHPGTLDRAHHHTVFAGWDPGDREVAPDMTEDPIGWVVARLGDLASVLGQSPTSPGRVAPADLAQVRRSIPEIREAIQRLLSEVRATSSATRPAQGPARVGWL
jgi:hypothetical protein